MLPAKPCSGSGEVVDCFYHLMKMVAILIFDQDRFKYF